MRDHRKNKRPGCKKMVRVDDVFRREFTEYVSRCGSRKVAAERMGISQNTVYNVLRDAVKLRASVFKKIYRKLKNRLIKANWACSRPELAPDCTGQQEREVPASAPKRVPVPKPDPAPAEPEGAQIQSSGPLQIKVTCDCGEPLAATPAVNFKDNTVYIRAEPCKRCAEEALTRLVKKAIYR